MFETLRSLFSSKAREEQVRAKLAELRDRMPVPVFWLLGKTQSGKSSLVRYLTGADAAQIGNGFQPCTRFSRMYDFPTAEAPLVRFLDTRGLEEPNYDPTEDLLKFEGETHLAIVTVRATDHAIEKLLAVLRPLKQRRPRLPVLLVLTTLHEAYPQQQHPLPYPFDSIGQAVGDALPAQMRGLWDCLVEQRTRFDGLVDRVVLVDLTPKDEGFNEPDYGGPQLREAIHSLLPEAIGQTLARLDDATSELRDLFERQAMPYILSYSSLAASAGAIPIPLIDIFLLAGIQSRMVYDLAKVYGQPLTGQRFLELGTALGMGLLTRQAIRSLTKIIPFFGSVASGALAGASTYALGRAFCYYYRAVHQGQVPKAEDLRKYYENELAAIQSRWFGVGKPQDPTQGK